jgi:hypothetical protein
MFEARNSMLAAVVLFYGLEYNKKIRKNGDTD